MRLKQLAKDSGGSTSDLFNLPLECLEPNPDNIRLDTAELREHIQGIADSIVASGFLRSRPLTVRLVGERAIVVDGNCRFAAAKLAAEQGAEILTLPCVPEAVGTTDAERTCNMLVANSGLAHSPLEMTVAVKKLLSYGWCEAQVARRLGKSRQYVANLLDLAGAGSDVHELISNGTVSATQAIKLIRSEGANAGEVIAKVAQQAKIEGKSRVTAKAFRKTETPNPIGNESVRPVPTVGLLGAAREILRIWDSGSLDQDFSEAIECLRAIVAPVREMAA